MQLDPSIHAYRKDIADIALAGQLIAPHYARPVVRKLETATALRQAPAGDAAGLASLEPGEEFAVLDIAGGWAWGYRRRDHLVGYIPTESLQPPATE